MFDDNFKGPRPKQIGNNAQVVDQLQFTSAEKDPANPEVIQSLLAGFSCVLNQLVVTNSGAADAYVQLHNIKGPLVITGAIPVISFNLPNDELPLSFAFPWEFSNGLVIALSADRWTFTAVDDPTLFYMVDLTRYI